MKFLHTFLQNRFAPYVFLFVVGFVLFGNVISGPFLLDDFSLIVKNTSITSFGNIGDWFTQHSLYGTNFTSNLYRPISTMTFATVYALFGATSFAYHIVNILIHIVNASLVFVILKRTLGASEKRASKSEVSAGVIMSFVMAVVFLAHPMNTEAVSYIAGLPDVLSTLFVLLGVHTFLREKTTKNILLVVLFGVLAILTKESAVIYAPLLAVVTLFQWRGYAKTDRNLVTKLFGGLILISAIYLVLKFTVFNFTDSVGLSTKDNEYTNSVTVRLSTFVWNLFEYFRIMFYPLELHFVKVYEYSSSLMNVKGIFGLFVIFAGFLGSIFSFKKHPVYMLGFLWFLVALAPMSGVVPLNTLYAERWLYLPSIGILMMLSYFFSRISEQRKGTLSLALVLFTLLTLALGIRTVQRNAEWANTLKFYENELTYDANSPRINNEIGVAYFEIQDYETAASHYEKAIEVMPVFGQAHFNLANTYMNLERVDEAITHYYLAIEHEPNLKDAYMALFQIYTHITNEPVKAREFDKLFKKVRNGEKVSNQEFLLIRDIK